MPRRQVLKVPGLPHHQNPIPQGVKIGNMVYSGSVSGADAAKGELPTDPETQVRNTFRNVGLLMEQAGGTTDDIAQMSISLGDGKTRKYLNEAWIEMFPNENDRPARHTQTHDINPRYHIQVEFVAVLDSK